ncbi:hypothetical protein KAR91_50415 [Candidatus Pacearchaeota archaeon]|nr:hypothetical protein [Candidatus Pacearchaeota archaeon]
MLKLLLATLTGSAPKAKKVSKPLDLTTRCQWDDEYGRKKTQNGVVKDVSVILHNLHKKGIGNTQADVELPKGRRG